MPALRIKGTQVLYNGTLSDATQLAPGGSEKLMITTTPTDFSALPHPELVRQANVNDAIVHYTVQTIQYTDGQLRFRGINNASTAGANSDRSDRGTFLFLTHRRPAAGRCADSDARPGSAIPAGLTQPQPANEDADSSDAGTFHGYACTVDCSGHEAGYNWAQEHDITDPDAVPASDPQFAFLYRRLLGIC